jgi:hypothetical protein
MTEQLPEQIWSACTKTPPRDWTQSEKAAILADPDLLASLLTWLEQDASAGYWTQVNIDFLSEQLPSLEP